MEQLILPEGLVSIGGNAFNSCTGLKTVTFSSTLQVVGDGAFIGCTALEEAVLPEGIQSISAGAFENCPSLSWNTYQSGLYLGTASNPYHFFFGTENPDLTSISFHPDTRVLTGSA